MAPDGAAAKEPPPSSANALLPIGAWLRFELPDRPNVVAFTYLDAEAGFSAQGWQHDGARLDDSARIIVRLPLPGVPWRCLTVAEVAQFHFESPPAWVAESYGPQPKAGGLWGAWRTHSKLSGRFSPEHPDDLQVLVHDGGPRVTRTSPELVWVSMTGMDGDVFSGRVLNQPHHLHSVRQGSAIKFLMPAGAPHPVLTTDQYLRERPAWTIHPCRQCELAELFDAPSELIRVVFPNTPPDAEMSMFTALCPLCGGMQGVESSQRPLSDSEQQCIPETPPKRPWWRFWK